MIRFVKFQRSGHYDEDEKTIGVAGEVYKNLFPALRAVDIEPTDYLSSIPLEVAAKGTEIIVDCSVLDQLAEKLGMAERFLEKNTAELRDSVMLDTGTRPVAPIAPR